VLVRGFEVSGGFVLGWVIRGVGGGGFVEVCGVAEMGFWGSAVGRWWCCEAVGLMWGLGGRMGWKDVGGGLC